MSNILYKIRCALARFMYGRNGADQLDWAMIGLSVLLSLIRSLLRSSVVAQVIYSLSLVLWIAAIFRMFSRNLEKRRAENAKFMAWWGPKRSELRGAKARLTDKTHKYVRCSCGTYCRVPRGVGKVELTCPKCGTKRIIKT